MRPLLDNLKTTLTWLLNVILTLVKYSQGNLLWFLACTAQYSLASKMGSFYHKVALLVPDEKLFVLILKVQNFFKTKRASFIGGHQAENCSPLITH